LCYAGVFQWKKMTFFLMLVAFPDDNGFLAAIFFDATTTTITTFAS
jgi:hypothetical protein